MTEKVAKNVEVVETETTEVVEAKPQTITPHNQDNSVEGFISAAIQQQLPVETIERFLAMRKEIKEDQAKEAFTMAMAKFQADCPVIAKTKPVKNKNGEVTYRYAPLESIILQVKKPLADNGLAYSFDEKREDGKLIAICTITHSMGHSKSASFEVEVGTEAYMTDTQKYGARMTFAKRYAFCNVLGIATGDEDTDAKELLSPEDKKAAKQAEIDGMDVSMELEVIQHTNDLDSLKRIWIGFAPELRENKVLIEAKDKRKVELEQDAAAEAPQEEPEEVTSPKKK